MPERTCSTDGCDSPIRCKGMCKPCYRRDYYRRNGERERANFKAWRDERVPQEHARFAAYYELKHGDEQRARSVALAERLAADDKTCSCCGEVKAKTEFHLDERRRDGRYSWCKACFQTHVAATQDPVLIRDQRRARYNSNPEFADRRRETHRLWSKANPINGRQNANKRRAREIAQAEAETVDFAAILAEFGMVCHICTEPIDGLDDLHFDHVIPLSKGGPHHADNIRPSHALCHLRQGARLIA